MIEKAVLGVVGVVVILTAAATGTVAAAYALFEVLREPVGAAGAAGIVAAAIFLLIGLGVAAIASGRQAKAKAAAERNPTAQLLNLAREKPILAAGALVAAGIVVAANPRLVATAVSAFAAGRANRKS